MRKPITFDHKGALIPAEFSRIVTQLKYTAPYVEKQIIYQYPGLMTHPDFPVKVGSERAETLYEQYFLYRENILKTAIDNVIIRDDALSEQEVINIHNKATGGR
jgi:hypothetical protein